MNTGTVAASGSNSTLPHSATRCSRTTDSSCRACPKVNSRNNVPTVEGAYTVEQRLHSAAAQQVDVGDAVRARAHARHHGGQLGCRVRRPGPDPRRDDRDLLRQKRVSPLCWANIIAGTRPADDTRRSSSNTADSAANLCETCTGSAFPNRT